MFKVSSKFIDTVILDNNYTRSFGAFDYEKTKDLVTQYNADNTELSKIVHDQGSTYMCWAYSITTMIRNSWIKTLQLMKQARASGAWDAQGGFYLKAEMAIRESSETFLEIRNLMLMTVIPKRIHVKDNLQSAYLKAAVIRVRYSIVVRIVSVIYTFKLTTKTAFEDEAIFSLRPLFYGDSSEMRYFLSCSNFKSTYQKYKNPFHPFLKQNLHPTHTSYSKYVSFNSLPSIFDYVMIKDKSNNALIKENEKLVPGKTSKYEAM